MSVTNLYARLKEYEDTGLEPEEAEACKVALMGKTLAEIKEIEGLSIERMKELAKAELEGRLLILPCKVGDTVYCIRKNPFAKGRYVKENIAESITVYRDHSISIFSTLNDVLGETVFLTREEAEAALTGGADNG